jgi:hypothetical protein
VQNNGYLVGRKLCPECKRYRCNHIQYSGGVNDQNKLIFNNQLKQSDAGVPSHAVYSLSFNNNSGVEHLQNRAYIGSVPTELIQNAELPSGQGITHVKFVPSTSMEQEKKKLERIKSSQLKSLQA